MQDTILEINERNYVCSIEIAVYVLYSDISAKMFITTHDRIIFSMAPILSFSSVVDVVLAEAA